MSDDSVHDHAVGDSATEVGDTVDSTAHGLRQWIGWILAPLWIVIPLLFDAPEGLPVGGWRTAGVALAMATLWISESIPIPATALLPLVLFPLLGIQSMKEAAAPFAHPLVFLFLGGFLIALAMQRWNLHKRIAIGLLSKVGTGQRRIIAGFLIASAFTSMWVSNTATALMMLPIALSVTTLIPAADQRQMRPFMTAVLLAVAYGSTTGGMATLIGTPPNALLAGTLDKVYNRQISFGSWMMLGVPVALVALVAVYVVLTRVSFRLGKGAVDGMAELLAAERTKIGRWTFAEAAVAVVFVLTAIMWVCGPLLKEAAPGIDDTVVALVGALLLFMIPVDLKKGTFVMDWSATKGLPWDVLLLFGGGLSLAGAISSHGLADYLGELCAGLAFLPTWVLLGIISFGILMLTELTSNTATAATFLPIVGAIAVSLGRDPLLFLVPTALAANCSYMMPVGTPPNAIVFGSGQIRLPQMARAGLVLNVILVPIILLMTMLIAPSALGMRLSSDSAPDAESGSVRLLPGLPIPDGESMRNNPMGEHPMPIQLPVSPHQRWSTSP